MYFTRLALKPQPDSQKLAKALLRDSYREHQALWRLFDEDQGAKRDFLYRQIFEAGKMRYYVLSSRKPHDKNNIWNIEGPKTYDPRLRKGQRLIFMLRANPIEFSSSGGRKRRHDVVMHAKTRMRYKELPFRQKPPMQKLIQESAAKWLEKRAPGNGFSFKAVEILAEGYRQHRVFRKRGGNPIIYSSVDFKGALTVSDSDLFQSMLMKGIGKSKAFGCGLMLIKNAI